MNKDNAKDYLPLIQALAEGKTIQCRNEHDANTWYDFHTINFTYSPSFYRIKPEPKLRPWKPEEIPVGALLRNKTSNNTSLIMGVDFHSDNCVMCYTGEWTTKDLLEKNEVSFDHGKTWLPCGVFE